MTDLQGWQKVAREIGDYECAMKYIGSGEYIEDMREVTDDGCVGDWLPAEAAAKEILRLRERLAELTSSLHEVAQKLQNGMDANPASSCDIFATLLYMHGLWMGRELAAAEQQQETDR